MSRHLTEFNRLEKELSLLAKKNGTSVRYLRKNTSEFGNLTAQRVHDILCRQIGCLKKEQEYMLEECRRHDVVNFNEYKKLKGV